MNQIGRHFWTLTPTEVTNSFRFYYYNYASYFLCITLVKLALLLFYLRIFPSTQVRRLLWSSIIFTMLYGIAYILAGIFVCSPIEYFWLGWDGAHQGHCINWNALGYSNAALGILMDVWMLAIPLAPLRKLSLNFRTKVSVGIMFSLGAM
jgi:hypothetical protein